MATLRVSLTRPPFARGLAVSLLLSCLSIVLLPASAHATNYLWVTNSNGDWNDARNWVCVPNTGPCGAFPNGVGDLAAFAGPFTRTVNVFLTTNITVGAIFVNDTNGVNVSRRAGVDPVLTFQQFFTGVPANITAGPLAEARDNIVFGVSVRLVSQLILDAGVRFSFRFPGQVSGAAGFTLQRSSVVRLERAIFPSNTFTGTTFVDSGTLFVGDAALPSHVHNLTGPLVVGTGTPTAGLAEAIVETSTHIEPPVEVRNGGRVVFRKSQVRSMLRVNGGVVTLHQPLYAQHLVLDNGTVELSDQAELASPTIESSGRSRIGSSGLRRTLNIVSAFDRVLTIHSGTLTLSNLHLERGAVISGEPDIPLIKTGSGRLEFTGGTFYGGPVFVSGELALFSPGTGVTTVLSDGRLVIGGGSSLRPVPQVVVELGGMLSALSSMEPDRLSVNGLAQIPVGFPAAVAPFRFEMAGGTFMTGTIGSLTLQRTVQATSSFAPAQITGEGPVFVSGAVTLNIPRGPKSLDLIIAAPLVGASTATINKVGAGILRLDGLNPFAGQTVLTEGTWLMNGAILSGFISLNGGMLSGVGTIGALSGTTGVISPGVDSPGVVNTGVLNSGPVKLNEGITYAVNLKGGATASVDRIDVTGEVTLNEPKLMLGSSGILPLDTTFTIIANDGGDAVEGTFKDLPEGTVIPLGDTTLTVSYHGGDGNDVTLTTPPLPLSPDSTLARLRQRAMTRPLAAYDLPEGTTLPEGKTLESAGQHFGHDSDGDLLIANPHDRDVAVTITFTRKDGTQIVDTRVLPRQSRTTIRGSDIAGLGTAAFSATVDAEADLPLIVERSMFAGEAWRRGYLGGANAPAHELVFADGAQGFFKTFVLMINPNESSAHVTATFLIDGKPAVSRTMAIDGAGRLTLDVSEIPELQDRTFAIVLRSTQPILAERAMYWPDGASGWRDGHTGVGAVEAAPRWGFAEGRRGGPRHFRTWLPIANPQKTAADVRVTFFREQGEPVVRHYTIAPASRFTIDTATIDGLQDTRFGAVIESANGTPIVVERSMYWDDGGMPFAGGANAHGIRLP